MCLKTEGYDTLLVGLVDLSELLRKLRLGNIGARGVQDINDELTAGQEAVGDELARADCNGSRWILERKYVREPTSI